MPVALLAVGALIVGTIFYPRIGLPIFAALLLFDLGFVTGYWFARRAAE